MQIKTLVNLDYLAGVQKMRRELTICGEGALVPEVFFWGLVDECGIFLEIFKLVLHQFFL